MKEDYETIDGDTLNKAFRNFTEANEDWRYYGAMVRHFFKLTKTYTLLEPSYQVPTKEANLIKAMASPNGYAICKVILSKEVE